MKTALAEARCSSEPWLGALSVEHVQICPQNPGNLTPKDADELISDNPDVKFRLHANVHVEDWTVDADASTYDRYPDYFDRLVEVSEAFRSPAYTWHAGHRKNASLEAIFKNTRQLEDRMGIPVGIEGMYPSRADYLISTWDEYEALFRSGVNYAIDLSHINILAHKTGERKDHLLVKLLSSDRCIEIHLSGNTGDADTHGQLASQPWWWETLSCANPQATLFTEGGQTRPVFF
ncbi:hypothetical protein BW247_04970 [Acidihalobacter ferrooxydans]|uniref:Xylose isomerase-like TIM barrel domain-containing protein n=1 Tax=Acidihalobacter ferrooxydans TaxID=1765967 RepID=A0A1P8UL54_9GAMM|nr:hypothetical protein BW247_04970 [Acidihalobacter ferrooxydans]